MPIRLKRVYEAADEADGRRLLVDRFWPRGLSKDVLRIDDWRRQAAPSPGLCKWFGHDPARWDEFKDRYFRELAERPAIVENLVAECRAGPVTLVFAARDPDHNNAVALKEHLEDRMRRSRA